MSDYYDAQNYATARAEYMYVNSSAVNEIAGEHGVEAAAGYDTFYTKTRINGIRFDLSIVTLSEGIDDPYIIRGRLPAPGNSEMIIDEVFADAHGVDVGAELDFDIATLKNITLNATQDGVQYSPEYDPVGYKFKVCGVYHSPDTIYKVNVMNTAAQPTEFLTAYVNYGDIPSYKPDATVTMPGAPTFSYGSLPDDIKVYKGVRILADDADLDAEEIFSRYTIKSAQDLASILYVDPSAPAGLYMYTLEQKNYPSVIAFDNINDTMAALAAVLPAIFFSVAAAITIISLSKTVDNQRMQIGVIQALGVQKSKVYFSYIFYALFASVVGGLLGGTAGLLLIPYLLNIIYSSTFCMPPVPGHVGVLYLILGVLISAALASLSAFLSCYRTLRSNPAQAMRPKPPKKTKRILAERWTWLWSRLNFGAKMNMRNMFLHKTRMFLSSVGIVGCLALLIALVGLKDNMAYSFVAYDNSVGYDMTIVTDAAVDLAAVDLNDVAGHDGAEYIEKLTFVPDFSAKFEFNGKSRDTTLMALPTKADESRLKYADSDCVKVYTDVHGKHRAEIEDGSLFIYTALADELGCDVGDVVRITGYSLDNAPIAFEAEVTEIVYEFFEQKAYCSYSLFEKNGVGLYADTSYAKAKDGISIDDAAALLIENSEENHVRDVRKFEDTFAAIKKQNSLLDYAVALFVVGAATLAIAVIYNITATNLKDRTREIATLMVLGYKPHETASMVIVENMVITGIGSVIGLPLGYGLLKWLVNVTNSFNVFISGFLSWYVAIGCIALTFVFSLVATMLLNTKMKKISMVEALKSVE